MVTSASSYCVKVTYTSLDHLLLGMDADVDEMSHEPSIARYAKDSRKNFWRLRSLKRRGEYIAPFADSRRASG
jgi:hypothetical protein